LESSSQCRRARPLLSRKLLSFIELRLRAFACGVSSPELFSFREKSHLRVHLQTTGNSGRSGIVFAFPRHRNRESS
jgi:hypothetical protein